jgi:glycosyltransferase involved in cell wall biosynthesis
MKLLFIIPELGYGGAETALLRLATELVKRHAVTIAVFRKTYQQGNYADSELITFLPVVELDRSGIALSRWMPNQLGRWWRRARELRRLKRQCDVSISFLGGANLLNALVRARKPCVISERGSKRHDSSGNPLSRWFWCSLLDPLAYCLADRIVCVSEGLSSEIRQAVPSQQRHKVHTIAGYLDSAQALAVRDVSIESELLSLANRPLLVSAGRIHPQKGFHLLLPLFAQVVPNVPDSGLVLIGDGPQLQDLVAQAKALGLTVCINKPGEPIDRKPQVIFLGYRPHPARYTKLGRAFVMPSLWEGLPNILLEALASGSWCLAADCPWGPAEILTDPELGMLLPPIQLASSRSIWIQALTNALLRPMGGELSFTLRRSIAERFSVAASAQLFETGLDALLNHRD